MMGKHFWPFLAVGLLAAALPLPGRAESPPAPAGSALIERDLGEGLAYYRVHVLPADLPPPAAKAGPIVLDLRYATAKDSAATALDAWLRFRATPITPVFVLINSATAASLRDLFANRKPRAGVLTIGPASADFSPDIAIASSPAEERHAYEALEHGATVKSLVTENADKPRVDEASIVRDRANPSTDSEQAADDEDDSADQAAPAAAPAPPPTIDYPLQRAVQLHRALLALKRL